MKSRHLVLPALLLLSPSISPLLAQEAPEPTARSEQEEVFQVPPEHASPRATMSTFLWSFDPDREQPGEDPLAVAAACLDLSEIPASLRGHQGRELAIQLKEVVDRTELIDLASLSDDPAAPPYQLDVHGRGQVVLPPTPTASGSSTPRPWRRSRRCWRR